jgi:glycerophosphoryl diester phosphodiesterase family protein
VGDPESATGLGSVGALLRTALALYRVHGRTYIALSAFAVVPVTIAIMAVALAARDPHAARTPLTDIAGAAEALLVFPMVFGATALAVAEQLSGRTPRAGPALRRTLSRASLFVGTTVLAAALMFAGLVLLIVPGVVLIVWFSFTWPVIALEDGSFGGALQRSRSLVRGRFWAVARADLAIMVVGFVAALAVAVPFIVLARPFADSERAQLAVSFLATLPSYLIVLPWSAIALTLLYVRALDRSTA